MLAHFVYLTLLVVIHSKAPNIIFIVIDDLGYDDLGFKNEHQINTPHIESLRNDGQWLQYYYGQANCSPTRTAIQTGLYPLHNSINTIIPPTNTYGVPLNFTFFGKTLHNNGYSTHAVGKWHMGFFKWAYTPTFRGYDSFYGYYNGAEDYYTHKTNGAFDFHDEIGIKCGSNCSRIATEVLGSYSAQLFTKRAIEIVTNHSKSSDNKPLFLYLPYQSVHAPAEVPQSYVIPYKNTINNTQRRTFAAMLSCVDEGIGNLTSTLKDLGYLDDNNGNTLMVITSDNGGPVHGAGAPIGQSNWPLRGGKSTVWEGGVRISGMIYGTKDIIPSSVRGTNYTQLMHVTDWYATLTSAAGINISNELNYTLDSVDHWEGIHNGNKNAKDKYFEYRDNVWMGYEVKDGFKNYNNTAYRYKWTKLINGSGGAQASGWYPPPSMDGFGYEQYYNHIVDQPLPYYLFNISDDPTEHKNITDNDLYNKLYSMMLQIEKNGVPQAEKTKDCPPLVHPNNSIVGPYWWPWCGM
eukprot:212864_1